MSSLLAAARTKRESGFTLIELLTVIVIIGILAAIAIPVFTSQRQRAVDAGSVSEARSVMTAIESLAAGSTAGIVSGDASTDAGRKALATALVSEGATSVLPKTAVGGTTNAYAGDTALATGDTYKTFVTFAGTGYTVETISSNGKASKANSADLPVTTTNANSAPTTVTGNNAKFDRSGSGVSAVTAGTVVLGW